MKKHFCTAALLSLAVSSIGLGLAAQPAAAAYDPSVLCPTSTPSAAEVEASVSTISENSNAAATTIGGVTVTAHDDDVNQTYAVSLSQGRSHRDYVYEETQKGDATRQVVDRATSTLYEGHLLGDKRFYTEYPAALKVLKTTQAWVKQQPDEYDAVTESAMLEKSFDVAGLSWLASSASETEGSPGTAFTCTVSGQQIVYTTTTDFATDDVQTQTYLIAFDDTGAVTGIVNTWTDKKHPAAQAGRTSSVTYTPVVVDLPTPVVTAKQWEAAVVQGKITTLRSVALLAARTKVATLDTEAKRVAAVRMIAKKKAAAIWTPKVSVTAVDGGSLVTTPKYGSTNKWWFRLRVRGATVSSTSNLG